MTFKVSFQSQLFYDSMTLWFYDSMILWFNSGNYRLASLTFIPGKIMVQELLEAISGHVKEAQVLCP